MLIALTILAVTWSETIALVVAAVAGLVLLYVLKALKSRELTGAWWEPLCEAAVHFVAEHVKDFHSDAAKQQSAIAQFAKLYERATGKLPSASIVKKAVQGIEVAYQIFKMDAEENAVVPVDVDE